MQTSLKKWAKEQAAIDQDERFHEKFKQERWVALDRRFYVIYIRAQRHGVEGIWPIFYWSEKTIILRMTRLFSTFCPM